MVLQYKEKNSKRWKDYFGKDKLSGLIEEYDFRVLNENKKRVLLRKGNYSRAVKRMREIGYLARKSKVSQIK